MYKRFKLFGGALMFTLLLILVVVGSLNTPIVGAGQTWPSGLGSSVNIEGMFSNNLTDTVTVYWYDSSGSQIKTTQHTVTGNETVSIWAPNEITQSVAFVEIKSRDRYVHAQIGTSNSTPDMSMGYRCTSTDPNQGDCGNPIYGPIVYAGDDNTIQSRVRLMRCEDTGGAILTTIAYYDSSGNTVSSNSQYLGKAISTLTPPAGCSSGCLLKVSAPYGNFSGVVETIKASNRVAAYPMIGIAADEVYIPRLIDGASLFTSTVYVGNVGASSESVTLVYYPDGGGSPSTYTANVAANGWAALQLPGTGNTDGAGRVYNNSGNNTLVVVARSDSPHNKAMGDLAGFVKTDVVYWAAINAYNGWGWYTATNIQNVDSSNNNLKVYWYWPNGSQQKSQNGVQPYRKKLFQPDQMPQNTVAGAQGNGVAIPSSQPIVMSVDQWNNPGTDRAFYSAEGTIGLSNKTLWCPIIYSN